MHELDTYNYNFRCIREPYLARLGSSGSCFCTGWHGALCGRLIRARMPVKTVRSGRSIPFFDRLHCNYEQNRYINYFRNVQEAYLAQLGLSDSFSAPASRACTRGGDTNHVIEICRLGRAGKKLGVACPLFSFFHTLHYKNKLYIDLYNFRRIRKQ